VEQCLSGKIVGKQPIEVAPEKLSPPGKAGKPKPIEVEPEKLSPPVKAGGPSLWRWSQRS
jgi:hypothetical protein